MNKAVRNLSSFGGVFTANVDGQTFYLVKDGYVLSRIAEEVADIGFLGSDFFRERETRPEAKVIRFEPIVRSVGRFVLASEEKKRNYYQEILKSAASAQIFRVATKYPVNMQRFANAFGFPLWAVESDSVEADVVMGFCDMAYDLKVSGRTLEDNNLEVVADGDALDVGIVYKNLPFWRGEEPELRYNESNNYGSINPTV